MASRTMMRTALFLAAAVAIQAIPLSSQHLDALTSGSDAKGHGKALDASSAAVVLEANTIRVRCTYSLIDQDADDLTQASSGGIPHDPTIEYGLCVTDDGVSYDIRDNLLADSIVLDTGDEVTLTLVKSTDELGKELWKIISIEKSRSYLELDAERRAKRGISLAADGSVKQLDILTIRMNYLDATPSYATPTELDEDLFRLQGDGSYSTPFTGSVADMLVNVSRGKMVMSRENSRIVDVNINKNFSEITGCPTETFKSDAIAAVQSQHGIDASQFTFRERTVASELATLLLSFTPRSMQASITSPRSPTTRLATKSTATVALGAASRALAVATTHACPTLAAATRGIGAEARTSRRTSWVTTLAFCIRVVRTARGALSSPPAPRARREVGR